MIFDMPIRRSKMMLIRLLHVLWFPLQYNKLHAHDCMYSQLDQCPRGEAYIPDDWTEIDADRFAYCAGLRSVIIPDSVLKIKIRAFYYCHNLHSIDLGKGVQVIETEAFQYCSSLKTLRIPASVTNIGGAPLSGCTSLVKVTVDPRNSYYMESDGVLFEMNRTIISTFQCPSGKSGSYKIPPYVSFIGNGSFAECHYLTSVEIPDSVLAIYEYAFYECISLQSVNIPSSCTELHAHAFDFCESLYSINPPNNRLSDSITEIGAYTFHCCYNLTHVEFGEYLVSIGDSAFMNAGVENLTFPATLNMIGPFAFHCAYSLCSIDFGGSYAYIDGLAFIECIKMDSILNAENIVYFGVESFERCNCITSFPAMQALVKIDAGAFYDCKSLESFNTGPYCEEISYQAFVGCNNLKTIVFGERLTTIGDYAFAFCALTAAYIPASITYIGMSIFFACEMMTEISVDENSTNFRSYGGVLFRWDTYYGEWNLWQYPCGRAGRYDVPAVVWYNEEHTRGDYLGTVNHGAFTHSYKLTEVYFKTMYHPSGYIGGPWLIDNNAFWMCTSLKSVTFPQSLQCICDYAFSDCVELTQVHIPVYVRYLGLAPFYRCGHVVMSVDPNNTYYTSQNNVLFSNNGKTLDLFTGNQTVYEIPNGVEIVTVGAFFGAKVTEITIPDTVTTLERFCFGETHIKSLVLPDSVTTVGLAICDECQQLEIIKLSANIQNITEEMFMNCTNLKSIVIPDSVVSICTKSFYACYALESIVFGKNVEYIAPFAFYYCMSLQSVDLPATLTCIYEGTFMYCMTLTHVVIGNFVRVIEVGAFDHCSSLISVNIPDSVEVIEDGAFANCSSLGSIVLGGNITTVNANVFVNCVSLESVYLPSSVSLLVDLAFDGCLKLTNVTYGGTSEPSGSVRVFSGCAILIEVHVPLEYDTQTFLSFPVTRPGDEIVLMNSGKDTMMIKMLCTASVIAIILEIVSAYFKTKRMLMKKESNSEISLSETSNESLVQQPLVCNQSLF